ncbi:hypothetical protein C7M84_024254 [Penaeus vannamei]|uniref:Ionotropic glutamate receptor C-terminal domain-containing protein n=1 Tax=Penaeus vannamei TaxID=6689 RepID=A0A3R7Q058_PENVA|nr:hypothetical protein C7M84_024254 [Penaeus vannamei]
MSQVVIHLAEYPGDGGPAILRWAGSWDDGRGVRLQDPPLQFKPPEHFHGRNMTLTTVFDSRCIYIREFRICGGMESPVQRLEAPDGALRTTLEEVDGYVAEVVRILQKRLNFSAVLTTTNTFGSLQENGSWNGMMSYLWKASTSLLTVLFLESTRYFLPLLPISPFIPFSFSPLSLPPISPLPQFLPSSLSPYFSPSLSPPFLPLPYPYSPLSQSPNFSSPPSPHFSLSPPPNFSPLNSPISLLSLPPFSPLPFSPPLLPTPLFLSPSLSPHSSHPPISPLSPPPFPLFSPSLSLPLLPSPPLLLSPLLFSPLPLTPLPPLSQEADLSPLDFSPSWDRAQAVDFSEWFSTDDVIVISKAPQPLVKPFLVFEVWFAVVASAVTSGLLLWGVDCLVKRAVAPNMTAEESYSKTASVSVGEMVASALKLFVLQGNQKWGSTLPGRALASCLFLVAISVVALYQGYIIAFLAVPRKAAPINSAFDLMARLPQVKPVVRKNTVYHHFVVNFENFSPSQPTSTLLLSPFFPLIFDNFPPIAAKTLLLSPFPLREFSPRSQPQPSSLSFSPELLFSPQIRANLNPPSFLLFSPITSIIFPHRSQPQPSFFLPFSPELRDFFPHRSHPNPPSLFPFPPRISRRFPPIVANLNPPSLLLFPPETSIISPIAATSTLLLSPFSPHNFE